MGKQHGIGILSISKMKLSAPLSICEILHSLYFSHIEQWLSACNTEFSLLPVSNSRHSFWFMKCGLLYISHLKIRMTIFLWEIRKSKHLMWTTGCTVSETPVCICVPVHRTCVCMCALQSPIRKCVSVYVTVCWVCVCQGVSGLRQVLSVRQQNS